MLANYSVQCLEQLAAPKSLKSSTNCRARPKYVIITGFSGFTTGLLHWLTGPYVHTLEYTPATQQLRIRTLSVLCQAVHTHAHLAEARLIILL